MAQGSPALLAWQARAQKAEQRAGQLEADLAAEQERAAAEVAEVEERAAAEVAQARALYRKREAELVALHEQQIARLREQPAAKRAEQAEQALQAAEEALKAAEGRLVGEAERHRQAVKDLDRSHRQAQAGARQSLAAAEAGVQAAETEAARVEGENEHLRAEVADLKAKLKPPIPEEFLAVRWLKDAPPGGAHVGDRRHEGKAGDVVLMPRGAAEALADQKGGARYVSILGAAGADLQFRDEAVWFGRTGTVQEMRTRAAGLLAVASSLERDLERLDQAAAAGGEG